MTIKEMVLKNRSYRRFQENVPVSLETLKELADLARLSASGGNLQSLKYILSCEPKNNALIFPCLMWAGYLKDWEGPAEGERPAAYVIILGDKQVSPSAGCDHGIAAQSMLLGATEKGLGGCMIGSIHRDKLRSALGIPDHLDVLLVIALGKPKETVKLDEVGPNGDIKYWRDDKDIHHVPKRSLDSVLWRI